MTAREIIEAEDPKRFTRRFQQKFNRPQRLQPQQHDPRYARPRQHDARDGQMIFRCREGWIRLVPGGDGSHYHIASSGNRNQYVDRETAFEMVRDLTGQYGGLSYRKRYHNGDWHPF